MGDDLVPQLDKHPISLVRKVRNGQYSGLAERHDPTNAHAVSGEASSIETTKVGDLVKWERRRVALLFLHSHIAEIWDVHPHANPLISVIEDRSTVAANRNSCIHKMGADLCRYGWDSHQHSASANGNIESSVSFIRGNGVHDSLNFNPLAIQPCRTHLFERWFD